MLVYCDENFDCDVRCCRRSLKFCFMCLKLFCGCIMVIIFGGLWLLRKEEDVDSSGGDGGGDGGGGGGRNDIVSVDCIDVG